MKAKKKGVTQCRRFWPHHLEKMEPRSMPPQCLPGWKCKARSRFSNPIQFHDRDD